MTVVPFPDPAEKLAAAMREYLAYRVRKGSPKWEADPEYALLMVAHVMLNNIMLKRSDTDDGKVDSGVRNRIDRLVGELDRMSDRRARRLTRTRRLAHRGG
jgi:hypothetical protein